MILSVVILFTDHDYMLLDRAISSIKEHVKFNDYEIILVDNRDNQSIKIERNDVKIVTQNKNLYTFEGRKFGFSFTQGQFVWNFDADDRMIGDLYKEDIKEEYDLLQMFYSFETKTPQESLIHRRSKLYLYGQNVWSRLYNRNLLQKIYDRIDKPIRVPKFEDRILYDFVMSYDPKFEYIERPIYEYNSSKSTTNKTLNRKIEKIGIDDYTYAYKIVGDERMGKELQNRVKQLAKLSEN